jgi:hypothetical protein
MINIDYKPTGLFSFFVVGVSISLEISICMELHIELPLMMNFMLHEKTYVSYVS